MIRTLQALKFLVVGPLVLVLLAVINLMTSPGAWWVQWPALGIGIAWVVCLMRVLWAIAVLGGIAAFVSWLGRRQAGETGAVRSGGAPT